MPRIKAESVAAHVAQQQAAVLDAAVRLFVADGYHEVSLGDIAAEVGLARNSLYRYVPDKSHLLVEWYRRAVPRIVEDWRTATRADGSPAERLQRWARAYLEWASTPEHRLVGPLTDALSSLDDATRRDVAELHRSMMAVVADVVGDADVPAEEVGATVELLSGLVLGAARAEAADGRPDETTRARLDAAIAALVGRDR
ncbi:MAG: TetR/AcrR family transcriptional regulator [Acidimicrobiales bacterium]|nr:TetR/AcrR family transcriptional regulator [Acidimicrobiales bacterium]